MWQTRHSLGADSLEIEMSQRLQGTHGASPSRNGDLHDLWVRGPEAPQPFVTSRPLTPFKQAEDSSPPELKGDSQSE